jgi:hypothetical protein
MEKYPVSMIYSGIHFSRKKKIAKGDEMNFIGEIAKTISVLLRNKVVFLAMKTFSHHLNG